MKKLLLTAIAAVLMVSLSNAQDVKKQQGGENNLELRLNPLGGSPIGIDGIRFRKFTSATSAIRAEVFLGFNNEVTDITLGGPDGEDEFKTIENSFTIEVAPGVESHFAGTDRLSPYVGAAVPIGFSSESTTQEGLDSDGDMGEMRTTDGTFFVGVTGLAGVDFYFADNIYLGAELGFGINYTINFDTVMEPIEGDNVETPNGNSFNVGPVVNSSIRFGFLF